MLSNVAVYAQQYKLKGSYRPLEYQKDSKWVKVKKNETVLHTNSMVRCKSDFTVQETAGKQAFHFCSPSIDGNRLYNLLDKFKGSNQSVTTIWSKSGSAYEIGEDNIVNESGLEETRNLHYLLVDIHSFEDDGWGDLGLPNVDLDAISKAIDTRLLASNNFVLQKHSLLYTKANTTSDSIRWHLQDLVNHVKKGQGDVVLLYLSSHGERSKNNNFCFITEDSHLDYMSGAITNYISGGEINHYVRELVEKSATVLVFIDACYAGVITLDLGKDDAIRKGNVAYYMSTDSDLKAFQDSKGSPFAEALVNALSGNEQLFFKESRNHVTPYNLEQYIHDFVNGKHQGQNPKCERGSSMSPHKALWRIKPQMTSDQIESLIASAGKGQTDAMIELGNLYYNGNEEAGVPVDYGKAYNYYKTAYSKGNTIATPKVGICYFYGNGVDQDYKEAIRYFDIGDGEDSDLSRYYLYVCYTKGLGVEKNKKMARSMANKVVKWYDDEIMDAMEKEQLNLPDVKIVYNDGHLSHYMGEDMGERVAVKLVRTFSDGTRTVGDIEADASNGDVKSQADIGAIYLFGLRNVKINTSKALHWLKEAAAKNEASAISNLGYCYSIGRGVQKDESKAWAYFKKAADMGYTPAIIAVGNYYFYGSSEVEQSDREAATYWQKAAAEGDMLGLYKLGLCYKYGIGVEQNDAQAVKWIEKSAKKGFSRAQYEYGNYFFCNKDYKKAYKWWNKAMEQGNAEAKKMINQHYYADGNVKPIMTSE